VATNSGGLALLEKGKWKVFNASNSTLPHNYLFNVSIDAFNNKWIGYSGGVAVFNENKLEGKLFQ
jgi:hypothetical protein